MFKRTGDGLAEPKQCYYLDVPLIHDDQSELGVGFIAALASQTDKKIFTHESIQILVGEHWKKWYWFNYYHRGIPLILISLLYTIWSNILLVNQERVSSESMTIMEVIIAIFALYFTLLNIWIEIKRRRQFKN